MKYLQYICILILFLATMSCASRKEVAYFQNIAESNIDGASYSPKLQPDDLLMIFVSAPDPEAAVPFNLSTVSVQQVARAGAAESAGGSQIFQNYLIDVEGNIEFPVIGKIKLGGLQRREALEKLHTEVRKYINNPIINLRILNYKVSVMGEVVRPGTFNVTTERITLMEALSLAGDLTIYGNRSNVLVIREVNGTKTHNFIDVTKSDFIKSPFYYLSQNDLVYVEPNKTRINASAVGPNITIIMSGVSLLIAVLALVIR